MKHFICILILALLEGITFVRADHIHNCCTANVFDGIFEFVSNTISTNGNRYAYNNAGDLAQDANKGLSLVEYDLFGHPRRIQHYNGNVTEYVYAATGEKLRVKHTTAVEGLTVPLGQTLELTTAQTMDVDKGVTDYQGNVRLVVDGNGAMAQRNDYYAYGGPWGDNASTQGFQPFKYNGKELDRMHGLDWNPDLQLDNNGKATVRFYNNGQKTSIAVSADGMTKDGQLLTGREGS